jgi:hypothetical protein
MTTIVCVCPNPRIRNAAFQLRDRCLRLGLVLYDNALAHEDVSAGTESVILYVRQNTSDDI